MDLESTNGNQELQSELVQSLDMNSWVSGPDLNELYSQIRLEKEVIDALKNEDIARKVLRDEVIPKFADLKLPYAGLHEVSLEQIRKAHYGLLFNGGVEATDGTIVTHDTLPITVTQIGVCLVSYNGEQGAYAHRLYRKDLRIRGDDPVNEVMELLKQRNARGAQGQEDTDRGEGGLSSLAQRGLMAYAERAILMAKSKAIWRMGHGNPFPYELMTGFWAGKLEMTKAALNVMRSIVEHQKIVFIPSAPSRRDLITLGNALNPREYIIIGTVEQYLAKIISGGVRGEMRKLQEEFAKECGPQIVIGLYRASQTAPAYMFYAHRAYAPTAAIIAIADSLLQEHRGFPMLIDIADNICSSTFDPAAFYASIRNSYAEAGQPFRFLAERETRNK